ncbi:MAG: L-threonylcarbamoyladenylate synthase [Rhodospirillales bacterium]
MRIIEPSADTIVEAAAIWRRGGLVAFPTETVYGLGADATSDQAVAGIFAAKQRPSFNPLIAHVLNAPAAQRHVEWNDRAETLAKAFWPGALTLVLKRRADCTLSLLASAGLDTAAIRVPAHPMAQALLRAIDRPIAAPSANRSGAISPTTAQHVAQSLGDQVEMIVDGGPCLVGLESTVVDLSSDTAKLLRPGGIARDRIEALIGKLAAPSGETLHSPGMMESHYAPSLPLRLNATDVSNIEGLLAFGPHVPSGAALTYNLSAVGNLTEAAANLFAMLRALDRPGLQRIAVMPIPKDGLGEAINDRLKRAAAPR